MDEAKREYIQFHIEKVGCRVCRANLDDLKAQQSEKGRPRLNCVDVATSKAVRDIWVSIRPNSRIAIFCNLHIMAFELRRAVFRPATANFDPRFVMSREPSLA